MAKGPNAPLLQKLGLEGPRALAYGAPLSPPPHHTLTERILFSLHKTTSAEPPREEEWALKESTTCDRNISSYKSISQDMRWSFAKTSFSVFSFEMPKVMTLTTKNYTNRERNKAIYVPDSNKHSIKQLLPVNYCIASTSTRSDLHIT